MTLFDWVWGVIRHPVLTYDRARKEMGADHLLIIVTVLSLHVVAALYGPPHKDGTPVMFGEAAFAAVLNHVLLVQLQGLLLMGSTRLFGWQPSFQEATRIVGLAWGVLLIQTIVSFYPLIKGMSAVLFWGSMPLDLWYALVMAIGVWRWSGLPFGRALASTALAVSPLFTYYYWAHYSSLP